MRMRFAAIGLTVLCVGSAHADQIDDIIKTEMQQRQIPGLSIAIIEGGRIVKAQGYGVTEKNGKTAVTPSTLFQAGSVSKSVAALGALHLVEQGKLSLDEDVNKKLLSWKVPDNEFTAAKKVTLRAILSHSAGLNVHGFPGYATDAPMPSVVQVLNGEKPANTAPVRVDMAPGSKWRYSGGGYTVMQLLMTDVTGKPFPELMHETVLKPLRMAASTFAQPPLAANAGANATGHFTDQQMVPGRWHIYPEMAAAGLWTNPSDLARFAIGIQQSLAGSANPAISAAMTRAMLTGQMENDGLGVFLKGSGKTLEFSHGGRDEGFDTRLSAFAETGQGVVIMINANDNSNMIQRIVAAIGAKYHWPDAAAPRITHGSTIKVDAKTLASYAGRYEIANNRMIAFTAKNGRLVSMVDGLPDEEFIPTAKREFQSNSRDTAISFVVDQRGYVIRAAAKTDGQEQQLARIGPLMQGSKPQADRLPARTAAVKTVLDALGRGGSAIADSALVTAGVKSDFGSQKVKELNGIASLKLLHEQDVSGLPFERHGGKVERVLSYQMRTGAKALPQYVLVYLTADNLVTDYDLVRD